MPFSPTIGQPHGSHQDFQSFELRRWTMWNISASLTTTYGATPPDGAMGYQTVTSGSPAKKHLVFYDATTGADIEVPRLDCGQNWSAVQNFNNYFTVPGTTKVTNLNADLLDGYDTSTTAVQNTIPVYSTGGTLFVATPTLGGHAVNKDYADALGAGINVATGGPARVATTAAIANLSNASVTIDGVTLVAGDRVLVKDTASPDGVVAVSHIYDGIYVVGTVSGGTAPFTRATDSNTTAELDRQYVLIDEGTANEGYSFFQTTNDPVVDTDALNYTTFYKPIDLVAGNGISIVARTISVLVSGSTTYTAGGILYHGSTSTISSAQLTGILKGNGTGAPTAVTGGTNRVTFWSDANTISSDANLTWASGVLGITGSWEVTKSGDPVCKITNSSADGTATLQIINDARTWSIQVRGDSGDAFTIRDETAGAVRWSITSAGILQSNGAQTVQTSSGILTIQGNAGATSVGGTMTVASTVTLTNSGLNFGASGTNGFFQYSTNLKLWGPASGSTQFNAGNGSGTYIFANSSETALWTITAAGILRANGAQTIDASNTLTIATTANNGNILLSPNGSGSVRQSKAVVAGVVDFISENTDNTDSSSGARTLCYVGGSSAGDPRFVLGITGVKEWSMGIDNSDSDTFKIGEDSAVGSNTRFCITVGGNVGIGTTSPGTRLEIKSGGVGDGILMRESYAGNSGLFSVLQNNGDGTGATLSLADGNGVTNIVLNSNPSSDSYINTGGKFGIGTTSPGAKLHLYQDDTNALETLIEQDGTGDVNLGLRTDFATAGTDEYSKIYFDANDAAGNNTRYSTIKAFIVDATNGSEDGRLSFSTMVAGADTETLSITGGRLGLNTIAPTYDLSFGGNSARTIGLERHSTADTAGNNFTISAGGATSGATNKAGGTLNLSSGIPTGTGTSGINFYYYAATGSGTSDGTQTLGFSLSGTGVINVPGLTASSLVQTDGSKNLVSSNTLPAATTIGGLTIAKAFTQLVGDGSNTSYTVTHNLGTTAVVVQVFKVSTGETWTVGVVRTGVNAVDVTFGFAPTSNEYRVVVISF